MQNSAALAYQQVGRQTVNPRLLEANLLSRAAGQMQRVRDDWDNERHELTAALMFNRKLWTVFLGSVTGEESAAQRAAREHRQSRPVRDEANHDHPGRTLGQQAHRADQHQPRDRCRAARRPELSSSDRYVTKESPLKPQRPNHRSRSGTWSPSANAPRCNAPHQEETRSPPSPLRGGIEGGGGAVSTEVPLATPTPGPSPQGGGERRLSCRQASGSQ